MIPAVFFDLDGVLADFVRGAFRLHGREVPFRTVQWDFCTQLGFNGPTDPAFWSPMDRVFWAGLDRHEDGFVLLRAVERMLPKERIGLLTSAMNGDGCIDGKRDWVARHLPEYLPRLFTGISKELFAGPGKVLVDDRDENCAAFRAAGGTDVLIPRPWNARAWACVPGGEFDPIALAATVRARLVVACRVAA